MSKGHTYDVELQFLSFSHVRGEETDQMVGRERERERPYFNSHVNLGMEMWSVVCHLAGHWRNK